MHPLHDYIARQLAEKVRARGVVVWFDARGEFLPFVAELRGGQGDGVGPIDVALDGVQAALLEHQGSMFELRVAAEPLVSSDQAPRLVVYVPAPAAVATESVLSELEASGVRYEPQLKGLARNLLRQKFTDGVIDELLERPGVTYDDIARAAQGGDEGDGLPSLLKSIYHDIPARDDLIAAWLAKDDRDEQIGAKGAADELAKLIESRTGLDTSGIDDLAKLRAVTRRYVLVGEFRDDLAGAPCSAIDGVPAPRTKPQSEAIVGLAQRLRRDHAPAYVAMADGLEAEFGLAGSGVPADSLGSTDTFRFEERAVLARVGELIVRERYEEAGQLVADREDSFWLKSDVARQQQWRAAELMVDLGRLAKTVRAEAASFSASPDGWIARYADPGGWHLLDQRQRQLETVVASLDEAPPEQALGLVRRAYEDATWLLAERFIAALRHSGWAAGAVSHQSQVFGNDVAKSSKPVAFFLVDAMRYEMGAELAGRFDSPAEVSIGPVMGMLPSITPVGMAALMPGASASFSVVESGGKLGSQIEGVFLPDLASRRKFAEARVPGLVDMSLAELLGSPPGKLEQRVSGAEVIVVRSQEIDAAGEGAFYFARRTMATVLDDLARGVRKLAQAGVNHAVVTADHGHLFPYEDRDEAHRVDAPTGDRVGLHRRCWVGRGGATPPGCIRVSAAALGYDSDLDLVFPPATAVFKTGGDLGYNHGGPTLQELVIPVVTIRTVTSSGAPKKEAISVTAPDAVTNRIFIATLQLGGPNLTMFSGPVVVQPVLLTAGRQVGRVTVASGAELDATTGTLTLEPGVPVTVGFMLNDDTVGSLRIHIVDPATDAELYKSPHDLPVSLLGVA